MKKTALAILYFAFACTAFFTSCTRDGISEAEDKKEQLSKGTLNLVFTLTTNGGAATRATTITPPNPLLSVNTGKEDNLNELRVFIFAQDGSLLKNEKLALSGTNTVKATIQMERPAGALDFYFVGNESKLENAEKAVLTTVTNRNDLLTKTDKMAILRTGSVKQETLNDYPYPYTAVYKGITIPQGTNVQFPQNPIALVHATSKVKVTIVNEAMGAGKEIMVRIGSIDGFAKNYRLFYKPEVSFNPAQSADQIAYELPLSMNFSFTPSQADITTPPTATTLNGKNYYGYRIPYIDYDVSANAQPAVNTYYISETLAPKPDNNIADEAERYKKQPGLYVLLIRPKQDGSSIAYMSEHYTAGAFPTGTVWYKEMEEIAKTWEFKNAGFVPISCEKANPAAFPAAYAVPTLAGNYNYDVFNAAQLTTNNVSQYSLFRNHQYNITVRVKGWPGETPMEIQPSIVGFTEVNTEVIIGG